MGFQTVVPFTLAFGITGELLFDGPQRADPLLVNSNGANPNIVGYAFTKNNLTNVASVGGIIAAGAVFAGILVNPKVYASSGGISGTLSPTLAIHDNSQGEFLTMGTIAAQIVGPANIGDQVTYNTTTGALAAVAPGASAPAGSALVPNAFVVNYPTTNSGLVAIRLTN